MWHTVALPERMKEFMRLKDKTAVITGSSSGIGRATAVLFAKQGARVVCVDMDEEGGKETLRLVNEYRQDAMFIKTDVSNSEEVRRMADTCQKNLKQVDVVFNNAGAVAWQTFEDTTEETWSKMIGTNLTSIYLCSRYLLPLIKASGGGSIINHASVDAIFGFAKVSAYSVAKGGIIPLTHVMAQDLGKYGIRVNCLNTGGIATPMGQSVVTSGSSEALQKLIAATPLGRRGTPEEVAQAALFLATDESSFINGASIVIDGGRTAITPGTT